MNSVSLNTLSIGERATVDSMSFHSANRRRMQDMGLISGTQVQCLMKAASGDPAAYLIRGAVIALRNEDAARISVIK